MAAKLSAHCNFILKNTTTLFRLQQCRLSLSSTNESFRRRKRVYAAHDLSAKKRKAPQEVIDESTFNLSGLARHQVEKSSPVVDVDAPYVYLKGSHKIPADSKKPKPRYLWEEFTDKGGFPSSPEEASVDLFTYLEQKDIHTRRSKIDIPVFCPGSIVAVTRADQFASNGTSRFVGICLSIKTWDNKMGASFRLRNVIDGEPIEYVFMTHSPLIQKIEILRHEARPSFDMMHLRDYPKEDSYVSQDMEAEPYTIEPKLFVPAPDHTYRIKKWFKGVFKQKSDRVAKVKIPR